MCVENNLSSITIHGAGWVMTAAHDPVLFVDCGALISFICAEVN